MIETMKKDRLVDNFHLVKVTLTWNGEYFSDCVSYCSYDIVISTNMIFSTLRATKIYKEKKVTILYSSVIGKKHII